MKIKGDVSSATLANTFKLPVLFLPLNLAVIGITTVMFLKHLNSVVKTIAAGDGPIYCRKYYRLKNFE